MKFIDSTEIIIRSGDGGRGMVSFHSGKNAPKLGADGGDGGHGGNVFLIGNSGLNTLSCVRYKQKYAAEEGQPGGVNGRTGRCGEDLYIAVPVGTIALDKASGRILCEVLDTEFPQLLAKGGKRGLGNMRFLSSRHQAPEEFTPGGKGEEIHLQLELKLLADVGFAGFPNAGKSTLLSSISAAKPKIADYPFTTLTPQLGVVEVAGTNEFEPRSFVAADIPGLIEGASEGRGLGIEFLKHLERTKVIAYVIDGYSSEGMSADEQFEKLKVELGKFDPKMREKQAFLVITKLDVIQEEEHLESLREFAKRQALPHQMISSVKREGLEDLKRGLYELVVKAGSAQLEQQVSNRPSLKDFELVTPSTDPGYDS